MLERLEEIILRIQEIRESNNSAYHLYELLQLEWEKLDITDKLNKDIDAD